MSIALLEALASGLPSIAEKTPAAESMVIPGGECIDMSNQGELADTIEKYFDGDLRKRVSENARKKAVEEYSADIVLDKIIEMYKAVLAR